MDEDKEVDLVKGTLRRKRFWQEAEQVLEAKYLQKVGILKSDQNSFSVRGICVQVFNPGEIF